MGLVAKTALLTFVLVLVTQDLCQTYPSRVTCGGRLCDSLEQDCDLGCHHLCYGDGVCRLEAEYSKYVCYCYDK